MKENNILNGAIIICAICGLVVTTCVAILMVCHFTQSKYNVYDVNHDGQINSQDYVLIKNYIMQNN